MKPPTEVYLDFSDFDVVPFLMSDPLPHGITVSEPSTVIQASESTGGIFLSVLISFPAGVASSMVATWLCEHLKKSGKPKTTINKNEVVFEEHRVIRFVEETITHQYRQHGSRSEDNE